LAKAYEVRGAQARHAERTGISPTRLSRLAAAEGEDTLPNLETALKLKDDPELPIEPTWWIQPPLRARAKGAA